MSLRPFILKQASSFTPRGSNCSTPYIWGRIILVQLCVILCMCLLRIAGWHPWLLPARCRWHPPPGSDTQKISRHGPLSSGGKIITRRGLRTALSLLCLDIKSLPSIVRVLAFPRPSAAQQEPSRRRGPWGQSQGGIQRRKPSR